ncbi:Protein kinase domain protein [Nitrococcus mobilis Nb-231]|uniref:Protein kinase domain protein n=1 Tax=Nitrococcus mobilis Nb-231 TaxID=314278 RepID=A4BLY5_9GAMM|nr:Protein kinase domain protein [Nitrococcus mobilis Nb-231]
MHPSAFPHEQEALDTLRAQLPETPPFRAWSNFEFIAADGSINEVDALVVSTDRVYLIEIKSWRGQITGNQNTWLVTQADGRQRYEENPLLLANRKAKKLKSLLARQLPFKKAAVPYPKFNVPKNNFAILRELRSAAAASGTTLRSFYKSAGSHDCFLHAARGGIGPEGLIDSRLIGLGAGGLAHVQGAAIAAVERGGDPALAGEGIA